MNLWIIVTPEKKKFICVLFKRRVAFLGAASIQITRMKTIMEKGERNLNNGRLVASTMMAK